MKYDEKISDIHSDLLDEMPDTYSKVKGTWLWEMFKAFALKIYELLQLLTDTAGKLNIENLRGDELDAYVLQWTDLKRKKAQRAEGYIEVTGNGTLYEGTLVSSGSIQYEITKDAVVNGTAFAPVIAVESGTAGNAAANTVTSMVTSNANIKSITNPSPIEGGTDEETDEALRDRYHLRLSMPATSGNRAHYILWATECTGVRGAKAVRDTVVNNKVNVYICGDNGESADSDTVKLVQEYIDPNMNGDGSGTAPIGAVCEVFSAGVKQINISGKVEPDNSISEEIMLENIKTAIAAYIRTINFRKTEVSYARLLNIALGCEGVSDVTDFKLNNGYINIVCDETEIFTLNKFSLEAE